MQAPKNQLLLVLVSTAAGLLKNAKKELLLELVSALAGLPETMSALAAASDTACATGPTAGVLTAAAQFGKQLLCRIV